MTGDEGIRSGTEGTADEAASPLCIRLFGPFEVRLSGQPPPRLRFRKSQAVLALLALRRGCGVERDWLAGLIWPESSGTHALRNCLTDLRRVLGPEACRLHSPTPRTIALQLTGASVDVLAFDAALARGDAGALEEAVALYRGPLLEGWVEEWVFQERRGREQAYLAARETLAAHTLARGDPAAAERHLRLAAAADPLRESAQRALMAVLAAGGNYAAALLVYRERRQRLHRELNAEPDPETKALFDRLRADAREKGGDRSTRSAGTRMADAGNGKRPPAFLTSLELASASGERGAERGLAPGSLVPLYSAAGDTRPLWGLLPEAVLKPAGFPHRLPLQLTSFIGGQAELAELRQQLSVSRLVTLTGAAGCGKTRLALEVAAGLAAAYPDGVCFVELARWRTPPWCRRASPPRWGSTSRRIVR